MRRLPFGPRRRDLDGLLRAGRAVGTRLPFDLGEELLRVASDLHRRLGTYVFLNAPPRPSVELESLQELGVLLLRPPLPLLRDGVGLPGLERHGSRASSFFVLVKLDKALHNFRQRVDAWRSAHRRL